MATIYDKSVGIGLKSSSALPATLEALEVEVVVGCLSSTVFDPVLMDQVHNCPPMTWEDYVQLASEPVRFPPPAFKRAPVLPSGYSQTQRGYALAVSVPVTPPLTNHYERQRLLTLQVLAQLAKDRAIKRRRVKRQEIQTCVQRTKMMDRIRRKHTRHLACAQRLRMAAQQIPEQVVNIVESFSLPLYNKFDILSVDVSCTNIVNNIAYVPRRYKKPIRPYEQKLRWKKPPRVQRLIVQGHAPENGPHVDSQAKADGGDNVVIQSTTEESTAQPTPVRSLIKSLCASKTNEKFASVVGRPCIGTPFEWKASHGPGFILKKYRLPVDFVKEFYTHEQMAGFRYSQYFRGDFVIKFTIAASPMVTGMCQIAWFYQSEADNAFDDKLHPVNFSMTNHALLNAATSNDAKLIIPYKNFRSFLQTTVNPTGLQDPPLYLGTLYVAVLNPLGIPPSCTPRVMITPHFWFESAEFSGMKSSTYGSPVAGEMPIIQLGQMIYRMYQVYQDYNRDKEIMPANPVPVSSRFGNLSAGTGVNEAVHALRLNPCAQVPHPELQVDQMQVDYVKNIFGYVSTFKWKSTHTVGDIVFSKSATPIWPMNEYASRVKDSQDIYYIPPVAFVAGLYREWRGSLEMRGDMIATKFHVGKLLISYLPGYWDPEAGNPSTIQLKSGLNVEVALSDGNAQFAVQIPFIYDLPYCPTPDQGFYDRQPSPGRIFVSVLTPLSTTCVVAPDVDINLYFRGGPDFEVAVPRNPMFGLSWDVTITKKDLAHEIKTKEGYWPMYAGVWHNFQSSASAVMRWGTLSDRIAEFVGAERGYIYQIHQADRKLIGDIGLQLEGKSFAYADLWFVPFDVNDGYGLVYLAVCKTEQDAKLVWCTQDSAGNFQPRGKRDATTKKFVWAPDYSHTITGQFEGQWTPDLYRLRFTGTETPNFPKLVTYQICSEDADGWSYLQRKLVEGHVFNEREATPPTITPQNLGPPQGAVLQFGESFVDFKDLIRRYWYMDSVKLAKHKAFGVMASVIVPIIPSGARLSVQTNMVDAYMREGLYTMIASQYRFFRGGMRVKLVFSWNNTNPIVVLVTHRPDVNVDKIIAVSKEGIKGYNLNVYTLNMGRGFAQTFTITSYNPTLEIEIPYYLRAERGLLQDDTDDYPAYFATNLGSILVDYQSHLDTADLEMQIYISGADDMRFDEYQGHPPVFPLRAAGAFDDPSFLAETQQQV